MTDVLLCRYFMHAITHSPDNLAKSMYQSGQVEFHGRTHRYLMLRIRGGSEKTLLIRQLSSQDDGVSSSTRAPIFASLTGGGLANRTLL